MQNYDAVIIGAGAAGGVVAGVLCEAGKRVLLLERGPVLGFNDVPRDQLRNQRLSLYGHGGGPNIEGHPRVIELQNGATKTVRPHEGGYHNNAACVGGGTRVYGAQAWRFMPQDFRMASLYGVPAGSSLADWPISYDDLAPHYEKAEWEIGVAGHGELNHQITPRAKGYPLPPVPNSPSREVLRRGAARLKWHTQPVPLLINTAPYNGRAACSQCSYCVGFACPTDAKSGSQNTMLPRALATGLCDLVPHAAAAKIETDVRGDVIGLSYFVEENGLKEKREVRAKKVIVSGGAVESARLLLNSCSDRHPHGLGNQHDQVGRHLQGHYYPGAFGWFDEIIHDGLGPGVSTATAQNNHGNPGIIGGGMLADEFIKLPIIFWRNCFPPGLKKWGLEAKHFMRDGYNRVLHVQGPVQEIPSPAGRVQIDETVRDKWGLPVARFSGTQHEETLRVSEFMRERAEEWLRASGAAKVWSHPTTLHLSGGQHQAGTCRMGNDPQTSVCDSFGRVHGHDNLFVIDGSLHVTNGGFNPVLTIMALAFRCAENLARH
jgi:choline dehydrogenase-like flavoprotein